MKKLILLLMFTSLLTACGSAEDKEAADSQTSADSERFNVVEVANDGVAAPLEFTLTNLDGEPVQASDYRGQWLVLNYWATWCAPCRDEIPELVRFQDEHDNVQILGIAFEDSTVERLKNFAADFNVNYPLLTLDIYDPPGFASEGGMGLPTTVIYNPEGMRHKKHMGPIDYPGLQELIK